MSVVLAFLAIAVLGALAYGWTRLRQEATAKITQLIFRKTHREGEGAVGRTHLVIAKSASATELLEAAWEAIDVPESEKAPNWWPASIFKSRIEGPKGILFQSKGRLALRLWAAALLTDDDGTQLLWNVIHARQIGGLVPEARSLANLERRVIRALRARDPYCEIITDESKVKWK